MGSRRHHSQKKKIHLRKKSTVDLCSHWEYIFSLTFFDPLNKEANLKVTADGDREVPATISDVF